MKTLKICRMISLLSIIACFSLRLVSSSENTKWLIGLIVIIAVMLTINQKYNTNRERHPSLLSEFSSKGVVIVQAVIALIFLVIAIVVMVQELSEGPSDPWEYLMWFSLVAYQIFNTLIQYKIRKSYDAENK